MAGLWVCCAVLLTSWGLLVRPGPVTPGPAPGETVVVLAPSPPGGMVSLWVRLDVPRGTTAWVVLGSPEGWGPAAELYWRRQVHRGWNFLTWDDLGALGDRGPLTLRLEAEGPAAWEIGDPHVAWRYGLSHLAPIRGLLAAVAAIAGLTLGACARWMRSPRVATPDAWTIAVLAVGALSLGLRLHTLATPSFWFDEVLTAIGAQSLSWVLYTPQIFGHPPLQYLATWLVTAGGIGEGSARAPFLVAGTGSVVAVAFLGRRLVGATSGLVGAALLGAAAFHVELSQLARPYALLILLSVLSFLALLRGIERPSGTGWLWFSALAALNVYSHYLAAQVLVVQGLVAALWVVRRRGMGWPGAALGFAGAGVLLLPWLPVAARVAQAHVGSGDVTLAMLLDLAWRVFVPQFLGPGVAGTAALALGCLGLVGLRGRPEAALALGGWIVVPFVVLWMGQPGHFLAGRHVAHVMPALMLLVAHGLTLAVRAARRPCPRLLRLPGPVPTRAAIAGGAALLLWGLAAPEALGDYYQRRQGPDWRTVAGVLDQLVAPGEPVLATLGAEYPLRHYWRSDVEGLGPARLAGPPVAAASRVWIVSLAGWDDSPEFARWLEVHAVKVEEIPASWSLPTVFIHRSR